MRIQVLFIALLFPTAALGKCFDFQTKITKPLREAGAVPTGQTGESIEKGKSDGKVWAAVRGTVRKPAKRVLDLLLDHDTTKSSRVDEMIVEQVDTPHYLALHKVRFLIKPFLFIKVRWVEQWAYALSEGSLADPQTIVISYEKIDGTSYIKHLCGNIVLRKLSDQETDVSQYEEAIAEQRSVDDTATGLQGTLKTLREK